MKGLGLFHVACGLCFRRSAIGDGVRIEKYAEGVDPFDPATEPEWAQEMTASGWASVVAHVSVRGETGETYRVALAAHQGGAP